MGKNNLHLKFRIEATNKLMGKFKTAKVSEINYIDQAGESKPGWGFANKKKSHKIYILRLESEIIYVGITTQPLINRFRSGLSAIGKNGFYGYAWKALSVKGGSKEIDLFVYNFSDEKMNYKEIKDATEAMEAEIVFLIRSERKHWPKYQTEIHFHQANSEEVSIAKQIYDEVSVSK
jgi:hypothetical protein